MYLLFVILMVIAALLMCFIVLIQNSKGGGLASGFSSSNAIMGVRKTTDFLEKATWGLAAFMVVMSIATAYVVPTSSSKTQDVIMEQAQQEKVYMERLPLVAMQIRSALGNIYYGMQKLAPADERDEDPILDANAAMLYHGYFRLLRLAKNLESASMLNRKELLPTENTDLKVWLDEIIREAEVPFELKGVQLEMVCEERYAITAVNEPWLSQALWQLLSNALKACSAGGKVTVTLAVQKPHVLIKVKDTGCGIPADRQEMLFRWHMRPMTLDYVAGGVGLGLPLAHQIARLHGGQLLLNSREGQGTTATIALPMVRALGTLGENIEDYTGGFQRVLLELADALPDEAFLAKHLDE